MINQFALNKSLLDRLNENTNLAIAVQGSKYVPNISDSYIAEKEVPTNSKGKLGQGSTVQKGFYQVTVCTPISLGKFYHLNEVNKIHPIFPNGVQAGIEFDGQIVSISNVTPSGMYSDDTHLKTALTINYTVIA